VILRFDEPTTDLLADLPGADLDDVAIRRLRQRVLADAARGEVTAAPAAARVSWPRAIPLTLAIVLGGTLSIWPARRLSDGSIPFAANVSAGDGTTARWSRRIAGGIEWIELSDGRFHIEVRAHDRIRRVAVRAPDGRIDDLGTVFNVAISGGHTTRVAVEVGSVMLRLEGTSAATVSAGEVWERRLNEPAEWETSHAEARAPRHVFAEAVHLGTTKARPGDAGLNAGDHRAEDDAYMNVIRLLRQARVAEAQTAAREYLRRFPDGFRRDELRMVSQ